MAKLLYSASAKLLETTVCFFDLQDTKDSPYFIRNSVTYLLVLEHAAQAVSQNAVTSFLYLLESRMP